MRISLILPLLALLLIASAAPPPFTARWDGTRAATVAFALDAPACLYRLPARSPAVFLACYAPGGYRVTFGRSGPLDAAYRPAANDVYVLDGDGAQQRAALVGVVWLPFVGDGG